MDLATAEVKVSQAETFINVKGYSNNERVENLHFEGIHFVNATWLEANERGMASAQSNTIVNEKGPFENVIPAAFNVNLASDITIHRNTFARIGKSAINAEKGITDIAITGNDFNDIAGTAVSIGSPTHGSLALAGQNLPTNITVSNNVLREIATQFWGAVGIAAYYYDTLAIEHNDIEGTNYSGISVGWGWSSTVDSLRNLGVNYNRIVNFNRKVTDGAAIYSLSSHVNSTYTGNYVKNSNGSFNAAGLYHDERSSNFVDEYNVIDLERGDYSAYNLNVNTNVRVNHLYTTTGNIVKYEPGPNVTVENVHIVPDGNWPQEALDIIASAGLESEYEDLLDEVELLLTQEDIPHLASSGLYFLDARLFNPYSTKVNRALLEAPFVEANGLVAFDATEYTGYTGVEVADYSYLGWVNAPTNKSAKYAMITHPKQMIREDITTGILPELSYDVQFSTPGEYEVYVLGKTGDVLVGFEGLEAGTIAFDSSFSWKNDGVTVNVPAAGVHTLQIWNTNTENSIERIVLIQAPDSQIYEGSTSVGPQTSPKVGYPHVTVPTAQTFPQFSADTSANVAVGKLVTASSTLEGYPPDYAADGLNATGWRSNSTDSPAWWQVDLGESTELKKVELHFPISAAESARSHFEVLGSNDAAFTNYDVLGEQELAVQVGDNVSYEPEDILKSYRYIRVQKTVNQEPLALSEVRVIAWDPVIANLALDKPVEVSSNDSHASRLVDEDVSENSGWVSDEGARPWVKLDLLDSYAITGIMLVADHVDKVNQLRVLNIYGANQSDFSDKVLIGSITNETEADGRAFVLIGDGTDNFRFISFESQSDEGSLALAEIDVYGIYPLQDDAMYVNLAQGKQTYATSEYSGAYVAWNAVDGNTNTNFVVRNWGNSEYFQVDLGQSYPIDKVQVVPRAIIDDWERKSFEVIASNDADFTTYRTIGEVGATAFGEGQIWSSVVTNQTPFRYIRVKKTDNQGIGFAEFRVLVEYATYSMETGELLPLIARMNGEDMLKQELIWSSSNPDAISVDANGIVRGIAPGQATITAAYSGYTVSIEVEVQGPPITQWMVSFNSDSGSSVADQTVVENGKVVEPADPTRSGYSFAGWYKEAGYTTPWDFDVDTVTGNTTLYAKWTALSSSGGNDNPSSGQPNSDTSGNAVPHELGTITTSNVNGQSLTTFLVDGEKLKQQLSGATQQPVLKIQDTQGSDVVNVQLNAQLLKDLEQSQAIIEITSANASYRLPLEQLNLDSIVEQFGSSVDAADIQLEVVIATLTDEQQEVILDKAADGSYKVIAPMIQFTVRAVYGESIREITSFNAYILRTIAIPEGVDPNAVATAVVIEEDGTLRPVPTTVALQDGKTVAVIQSLTNSTYALVSNQPVLEDIQGHWAQAIIKDLSARMIISGTGNNQFMPNRDITRAEFVSILVRGLGLRLEEGQALFSDVQSSDWYSKALQTAHGLDLVNGYEDGTFRPMGKITREQAMMMIAKAMKVTGLSEKLAASGSDELLAPFVDASNISTWAIEGVIDSLSAGIVSGRDGMKLAPRAYITRAEVAVIIHKLLVKSDLI